MMTYEQLGKLIKDAREAKKMTQQDLAQKFGLGVSAISNWETGLRGPRVLEFIELVHLLGIADKLFGHPIVLMPSSSHPELENLKQQVHFLQKRVEEIEKIKQA